MNEKMLKKLEDKEFVKKIINIESAENVVKAFKDENIEVTEEEVNQLGEIVGDMISKISELPEDELKNISGGNIQDVVDMAVDWYTKPGKILGSSIGEVLESGKGILNDDSISNATILAVTALQTYGIYKAGKWAINKGKQWWQGKKSNK